MAPADDKRFEMCQEQIKAIRSDHKDACRELRDSQKEDNKVIFGKLDAIYRTMHGNGKPGVVVDVAMLKQESKERKWWLRAAAASIIGLCTSGIYAIFFGKGS